MRGIVARRKIAAARVLVVIAVMAGGVAVSASPVHAAIGDCPSGRACMWSGFDFVGTIWAVSSAVAPPGSCVPVGSVFNDRAASYYNHRSDKHVSFYKDAGCTGLRLNRSGPVRPGGAGNFDRQCCAYAASSVFIHTG